MALCPGDPKAASGAKGLVQSPATPELISCLDNPGGLPTLHFMAELDPASPVPLYHQLAEKLLAGIRSGDYPSGGRLPSEPELSRRYRIGRPTVRQATDVLVRRRMVERRRGSGTFVIEPPERVDLLSLAGTLASFERGGVDAQVEPLGPPVREVVPVDVENPLSGREALRFLRLSRVDSVPVLLEEIYLDPRFFPGIQSSDLSGRSLSQWIEERYQMRPSSADQNFRVAEVGDRFASDLQLPARSSILMVKRTVHFEGARNAIHALLYCRTERLVFSQTLEGQSHE